VLDVTAVMTGTDDTSIYDPSKKMPRKEIARLE